MKDLEANPSSKPRQGVLSEEVLSAKADQDAELLKAAQALLKAIKAQTSGEQIVQMAMGDQNVQVSGDGNVISVGMPRNKK